LWLLSCLALLVLYVHAQPMTSRNGHLKPFGEHRPAEGEIQSVDGNAVTPEQFWEFHRRQEVVVLKNVTTSWPALKNWNDAKLSEKGGWGDFIMRTEGKVEGTMAPENVQLSTFLEQIQSQRYVVGELPEPMYKDVVVPGCFTCGPFSGHITEVDIWISNGETRSKFHKDSNNQLNCLVKGRKRWTVIDPTHIRKIPMMWEDSDPAEKTAGESLLDPLRVDLERYPEVAEVPYNRSWLEPGDCIWMPGSTLHQVYSTADDAGRNLQVSLLFSELVSVRKGMKGFNPPAAFDPNDSHKCSDGWGPKPLSEYYVAWPYPGKGGTTYGFDCPKKFRMRMGYFLEANFGTGQVEKAKWMDLYKHMLMADFPNKPTDKLFVFAGHQHYIPDALEIMNRRQNYNLGPPEVWGRKAVHKKGGRIYYPGIREAAVNLALKAFDDWWKQSPLTQDGGLSKDEMFSVSVREFQESWAFLYFPVQSIGHAFIGAMEHDEVRYMEMMEEQEEEHERRKKIGHHDEV